MDFQFFIECPQDGQVTVNMNHLMYIAAHGDSQARLSFRCPKCGRRLNTIEDIPAEVYTMLKSLTMGDISGIKELFDKSMERFNDMDQGDEDGANIRKIFLSPEDLKREDVQNFLKGFSDGPKGPEGFPFMDMLRKGPREPRFDASEHTRKLGREEQAQIDYYNHQLDGITTIDDLLDELK